MASRASLNFLEAFFYLFSVASECFLCRFPLPKKIIFEF
nr:MAG TPA: RING finger protein Z FEVER VIRUS-Z, RING, NEGATIVE [Bacteriophage sp.]